MNESKNCRIHRNFIFLLILNKLLKNQCYLKKKRKERKSLLYCRKGWLKIIFVINVTKTWMSQSYLKKKNIYIKNLILLVFSK